MKMKFNLKNLKLKELAINHAEKGVLAIGAVFLLMFLVSAAQREKLPPEREPEKLRDMTQQTKQHVEQSTFDPKMVESSPPEYAQRVRRDPVLLATYDTPVAFDGPIIDAKLLRDQPPVLTVRELRVGTGFAPFALQSPEMEEAGLNRPRRPRPGALGDEPLEETRIVDRQFSGGAVKVPKGAKLEVRYWAMITGLIPVRAQKQEFFKTFELAAGFDRQADLPRYLGYQIERAEVTSGSREDLKWTPVSLDKEFMLQWVDTEIEPVQAEFVTPRFVAKLGPRVGSEWEDYVGHLPQIKFEEQRGPGRGGPGGFGLGPGGMTGGGRGRMMPGPGMGMGGGPDAMGDAEEEEVGEMFESSRLRRRTNIVEEDPEERRRLAEEVAMIGEKPIKGVDNLLFRFCDFSVKPGKKYVYRVRLGLANPNRNVEVKNLRKPELRDAKALISDWSEPTPVASIPHGDKLLAGPITPATVTKDPVGKIRIVQVKEEIGAEVPLETDVYRGSLANFRKAETEYVDPTDNTVRDFTGDFITDSVVLDVRGGRPLLSRSRELTEPGEMLVLSRDGKMMAMHEFADEDTWLNYAVPEEEVRGPDTEGPGIGFDPLRGRGPGPGVGPGPGIGTPSPPRRAPRGGGGLSSPPAQGFDPLMSGAAGGGRPRRPPRGGSK